MGIEDYLKDELKRLNRMNDLLEKKINQGKSFSREPERVIENVKTMCQIVNTLSIILPGEKECNCKNQ